MALTSEADVRDAANAIVAAFARHDTATYFASFTSDATFVFHATAQIVRGRAQYEELWRSWEQEGFHVVACESSDAVVQMIGDDAAVFIHSVRTTVADGDSTITTGERETIVFHKSRGTWLGVHEHLSVDPTY